MILGIISAIVCTVLFFKAISRKLAWHTVDKIVRKIHIPCAIFVIVLVGMHLLVTLDVWPMRSVYLIGTGIGAAMLLLLMAVGYIFRNKLKSKWLVLHKSAACILALLIISHILIYYVGFFSYKNRISTIEITGMNASNVKNGTYIGEYDAGYIYAKVSVTVKNKKILKVTLLEHKNERGKPAEKITNYMVEQQNTKVDVVSGATNSSLVIEKAVENALEKVKS